MRKIKINSLYQIPNNFTGIAEWKDENTDEKWWFRNGKHHCIKKPANIWPGGERWYQDDKLHRIDGPAFVLYAVASYESVEKYYIHGFELTKSQHQIFQFLWKNTQKKKTKKLMMIFVKLVMAK